MKETDEGRVSTEESYRERECVHRRRGAAGEFYHGTTYVRWLQRLKAGAAAQFAARVTPFFWADAARVRVWLCEECATELRGFARASE